MNFQEYCCCCPEDGIQIKVSCKYACCNSTLDTTDGIEQPQNCPPEDSVSPNWKCCCLLISRKTYRLAKKRFRSLTRKEVLAFRESEPSYTQHRPIVKKFPRRKTYAKHLNYLWQLDLADVSSLYKTNRSYRYLLVQIDVLSRFAHVVPLKTKNASDVLQGFKKILAKSKEQPVKIQTDRGKEFYNRIFRSFLRQKGIVHYSSLNVEKAALVERLNRTLKNLMYKYFTAKNTLSYWRVLEKLVHTYNSRIHRAIGIAPANVNRKNQKKIYERLYGNVIPSISASAYKVGDRVRIAKYRYTFTRGFTQTFTTEIFEIRKILPTKPLTYKLFDLKGEEIIGSFYAQELSRVRIK